MKNTKNLREGEAMGQEAVRRLFPFDGARDVLSGVWIKSKTTLWFSKLSNLGFILFKLVSNLVRVPYYLYKNPSFLIFDYLKHFVDQTINLELTYRERLETLEASGLQKLLQGPAPYLQVLFESAYGNINFLEAVFIGYIIQARQPKHLFEIGTFDGFSTYHLAKNSSSDSCIWTLNLPLESNFEDYEHLYSLTEYHGDHRTNALVKEHGIGRLYRQSDAANKVVQLYGNSLEFDFSPYHKTIDFCFVDGGHSFLHLESDTSNALKMLRKGGVLIWHDYNVQHRDIYRYLNEFSRNHKLYRLANTRLAMYIQESN